MPGDTNDSLDVFVRDRELGTTRRVSVSSTGAQGDSDELRAGDQFGGRYVAFSSAASNLVPGDTNAAQDVFVRDRELGTTRRVSVSDTGAQGDSVSFDPAISSAGRYVAFSSDASNLVPGDTEGTVDVFVRDRDLGTTRRVSVSSTGAQSNRISFEPAISSAGRYVAFVRRVEPGARRHQRLSRRVRPNSWRSSVAANSTIQPGRVAGRQRLPTCLRWSGAGWHLRACRDSNPKPSDP